jgi:hypothetical protein
MTDGKTANAPVRRQVASARLASWTGFIGAVAFLVAVMLLCFHGTNLEFNPGSLVLPAGIAVAGLVMMAGGRVLVQRSEAIFSPRPRLRLVGKHRTEIAAKARRTAA